MMFIKDRHSLAQETDGIQDDVMDEDDKTQVKNRAHCVIKMINQRALSSSSDRLRPQWSRLASLSRIVLSWHKGGPKALSREVSLDGPTR
jgi:hypothetical protein